MQAQADELVLTVVQALDGVQETETRRRRCSSCASPSRPADDGEAEAEAGEVEIESAKAQVVNLVNTFFRDRLTAVPSIKDYMDSLATS